MNTEEYNDEMIDEMLEESALKAPEEITTNIVAALPSIYRRKRSKVTEFWPRRKWIMTALAGAVIMTIFTILLTMTALRLISVKAKTILGVNRPNSEESPR